MRQAPTAEELRQVEDLVNRRIIENHPVRPFVTTREYAAEIGALAFFEEKYGEFVRVLEIDDFSRELCGGTHVSSTSEIGLLKITASQSVGANTRRVEAITSAAAVEHFRGLERRVAAARRRAAREARPRLGGRRAAGRRARPTCTTSSRRRRAASAATRWAPCWPQAVELDGVTLVAASPQVDAADELLALADGVRAARDDAVVLLLAAADGRVAAVVAAGDAAVGRGLHAQEVLRAMMPAIDGKGGGKPTLARGGGSRAEGIEAALQAGVAKARELLGS